MYDVALKKTKKKDKNNILCGISTQREGLDIEMGKEGHKTVQWAHEMDVLTRQKNRGNYKDSRHKERN
jgi:hypothetical protein